MNLCGPLLSSLAPNLMPTVQFVTPYEETEVPASQWLTTYSWRFATWNGGASSGWTGWSSFFRSF